MFRGRTSEVINVGGVKVHPLPIEERVGAVPGVDMARVYGRPNAMTGAIVAVEVVAAPGADTDARRRRHPRRVRRPAGGRPAAQHPLRRRVARPGDKIVRRDTQ